jgi:hypothetical protein
MSTFGPKGGIRGRGSSNFPTHKSPKNVQTHVQTPPFSVETPSFDFRCLIHGKTVQSVFTIKTVKNLSLEELRELIWKKKYEIWQKDITIWIVNIPFDSPNLGDETVDIATTFNGQIFLPTFKIGDRLQPPLAQDRIHLLIQKELSIGK